MAETDKDPATDSDSPDVELDEETVHEPTDEQPDDKPEAAADEVYCTSCGEPIKEEAELCPECGVRQEGSADEAGGTTSRDLPDSRVYELQKVARKSPAVAATLGFLISPVGYWYVGKTGLAIINLLTFNFFLLGIIIVPIHSYKTIKDARKELRVHGEGW